MPGGGKSLNTALSAISPLLSAVRLEKHSAVCRPSVDPVRIHQIDNFTLGLESSPSLPLYLFNTVLVFLLKIISSLPITGAERV